MLSSSSISSSTSGSIIFSTKDFIASSSFNIALSTASCIAFSSASIFNALYNSSFKTIELSSVYFDKSILFTSSIFADNTSLLALKIRLSLALFKFLSASFILSCLTFTSTKESLASFKASLKIFHEFGV